MITEEQYDMIELHVGDSVEHRRYLSDEWRRAKVVDIDTNRSHSGGLLYVEDIETGTRLDYTLISVISKDGRAVLRFNEEQIRAATLSINNISNIDKCCNHNWVITEGFITNYTDCSICKAKKEDI